MRRVFKIMAIVLLVIVALFVSVFAIIGLDVAGLTATGSQTLNSCGNSVGHALVVYDPGLSGSAKDAATRIASDLQAKGYTVDLAGVKSKTAEITASYNITLQVVQCIGEPQQAQSKDISRD
jgi:hypothetical protein